MANGSSGHAPAGASDQGDGLLLGQTSAHTFSLLEAVMTETLGMSMHNAVRAQNGMQAVSSAAVVAACARMLNATPPAPPPAPKPAPTPPAPPAPDGGAAAIARDTVRAGTAVNALAQDAERASANAASAASALQALVQQAQAALPPPAPTPSPAPAPTPTPAPTPAPHDPHTS